jgi:hypothetical protein
MRVAKVVLSAALVFASACASSQANDGELRAVQSQAKKTSNVITQDELHDPKVVSRDAYTAIRMLRPHFFTYRGPTGDSGPMSGGVQISFDYGPLQSGTLLAQEKTNNFVEVRYLNSNEAALRFGLNANGGPVIVLLHNKE